MYTFSLCEIVFLLDKGAYILVTFFKMCLPIENKVHIKEENNEEKSKGSTYFKCM